MEVDLEYLDELHDLYNDYSLAPEKAKISQNILSNYCCDVSNKYDLKIGGLNKLVPNVANKNKHVLRHRNLQLYLSLGMKLAKIHRILKFNQSNLLNKYIYLVQEKNAFNSFKKDFLKVINNSVYGKTMDNLN